MLTTSQENDYNINPINFDDGKLNFKHSFVLLFARVIPKLI